jgi:hypothetical protein
VASLVARWYVAHSDAQSKVDHFLENEAKGLHPSPPLSSSLPLNRRAGTKIIGAHSIEELCSKLKRPRKIILLVKAGTAVDDFIGQIIPHLEKGDIIIDGGNSHYPDSIRRTKELEDKGFLFVGSGVSGGEEGARYGPSLSEYHRSHVLCRCGSDLKHSARRQRRRVAGHQGDLPEDRRPDRRRALL